MTTLVHNHLYLLLQQVSQQWNSSDGLWQKIFEILMNNKQIIVIKGSAIVLHQLFTLDIEQELCLL